MHTVIPELDSTGAVGRRARPTGYAMDEKQAYLQYSVEAQLPSTASARLYKAIT